jgi:hypothetical protein
MPAIRYRNGLKVKGMYCAFCCSRVTGTVYREKLRWMAKLSCGHLSFRGWIAPPEELEKRGLLNEQLSQQKKARDLREQLDQMNEEEARERLRFEMRKAIANGDIAPPRKRMREGTMEDAVEMEKCPLCAGDRVFASVGGRRCGDCQSQWNPKDLPKRR